MVEALRALVIDDSPTDRQTLVYLLTKKLGCAVEAAGDGLEGLDKLSRYRFDVIFLDLVMPLMSGHEVLQEIRACPQTATMPVVVISGESDPKVVKSVLDLKIFDYILKPYHADVVVKRFAKSLNKLRAAMCVASSYNPQEHETLELDDRPVALIADEDANFRHFFAATVGTNFHVLEASNGAQAVATALKYRPTYLFAGSQLGTYGRSRMVNKLRGMNQLPALKIYAIVANEQETIPERSLYNGLVTRSFVPEVFSKSLDQVLPAGGNAERPVHDFAEQLKPALMSATEQVFGMMLSTEVSVVEEPARVDDSTPILIGSIALVSYAEEKRINVAMSCDRDSAVTMAKRMLREEEGVEGTELVASSLAEVLNIIGARLRNSLGEVQREFLLGLPAVEERLGAAVSASLRRGAVTSFDADGQLSFSIALGVESCEKFKVSRSNLGEGTVLAQTLEVSELGKLAKGLRLDGATIATLQNYGPAEIEVFGGAL